MTKERDVRNSVVTCDGDYTIVRSEAREYDEWNQRYKGRTKVYYDVCDGDDNLLNSFKTLREAKKWMEEMK